MSGLTHVIDPGGNHWLDVGRGTAFQTGVPPQMLDKIEYATRQALAARQNAAEALDNVIIEQWAQVAQMWEDLIREFRALQRENAGPAPE